MQHDTPISVSDLNRLARLALEQTLPLCWVSGETSNLTRATSGHWYFTLKDSGANVRCVMFRNRNQFVDWSPREGEQVEVLAQATLYEARGDFQLTVEAMRHAGQGALFEAFLRLKAKLEQEGLFDSTRKQPLPAYPVSIGLITSPQGAALHDALTILLRRWPMAKVFLYPTSVQGEQAPEQIISAIEMAQSRGECEVLLLIRGGGSLEDLRAFNNEAVARAIAACRLPVIAGIGHETDFTIADFVADLRAPTPTAAAQLATPNRADLVERRSMLLRKLTDGLRRYLDILSQSVDLFYRSLKHPHERLYTAKSLVNGLHNRLVISTERVVMTRRDAIHTLTFRLANASSNRLLLFQELRRAIGQLAASVRIGLRQQHSTLVNFTEQLELLNPRAVLSRGYALVRDASGQVIRTPSQVQDRQLIEIELATGVLSANVILD